MGRQPSFLEVMAMISTILAAVLTVAEWMLKIM